MYEEMFRKQEEMEQRKQKRKEQKLVKKPGASTSQVAEGSASQAPQDIVQDPIQKR